MYQTTILLSRMIVAACLLSLFVAGCSKQPARVGEETKVTAVGDGINVTSTDKRSLSATGKIAGEETALVSLRASVQAIDKTNRTLTLKAPAGTINTIKVGPEVRNFNQIAVGDKVAVEYYASVVFETRQPTAEELALSKSAVAASARAKLGDKPAAFAAESAITVVTVDSIDTKAQTVTLRDDAGKLTTIKAKYPENLNYIAKGDKVVATVTEALAAKVTPIN